MLTVLSLTGLLMDMLEQTFFSTGRLLLLIPTINVELYSEALASTADCEKYDVEIT